MKMLKRGPISIEHQIATDLLGSVLEVETSDSRIRWRKGSNRFYWDPDQKCLMWYEGGRKGRSGAIDDPGTAGRSFKAWTGKNPQYERTDTIPDVRTPVWVSYGRIVRLDYASSKWGKDEYTHNHGKKVRLYRWGGKTKAPWIWVVKGGNLRITNRGIEG